MSSPQTWKEKLQNCLPPSVEEEIDIFESQVDLRRQGGIDEKVFAETRLRRGVYGQRYDNGQRHDGLAAQTLLFPSGELTKGPHTLWDAPGMQRIKLPFGEVTAEQMEVMADLAEEYSDGIVHITTRQDVQLHYIHIEDTPDLMRRLAATGITTREACGNSVRNITGCPIAGVCGDESFDVTPYAKALTLFLLGHPDAQDFGRKFKISFSGCAHNACALANMHDIGLVAKTRQGDSGPEQGFEMWVGGGLGAVPHEAKLFDAFLAAEELLPISQAICRVFARLGEKRNRAKARLKFVVSKLGIEEFRRLVLEERTKLDEDSRWTTLLPSHREIPADGLDHGDAAGPFVEAYDAWLRLREEATAKPAPIPDGLHPEGFAAWRATNVTAQRQAGYFYVVVRLPLGDLTGPQTRALADLSRRVNGGFLRATVEQNLILRWVSGADVVRVYQDLAAVGLAQGGAGTVIDITSCPGTDTCKLGISSSRGLAAELSGRLAIRAHQLDAAVQNLRIKVSGCFNSCGQHHVADLGFYGVSRKAGGRVVPHFQVVLGGQWSENGGAYGLPMGAVPSKNIPDVVDRLTSHYIRERDGDESFQDFIRRVGKTAIKTLLADLMPIASYAERPDLYSDWGDAREYTIDDLGIGECAGEIVSLVDFGLADAERVVFEAQVALDEDKSDFAGEQAYRSMLAAAKGLVQIEWPMVGDDPATIVRELRSRFHDTGKIHDPFAGDKFVNYLFHAHDEAQGGAARFDREAARRRIEEAQLFIEAAHACNARLTQS